jgi:histidine ammonia-lyase
MFILKAHRSSGDLVPLAHMALPLIGEGEVTIKIINANKGGI